MENTESSKGPLNLNSNLEPDSDSAEEWIMKLLEELEKYEANLAQIVDYVNKISARVQGLTQIMITEFDVDVDRVVNEFDRQMEHIQREEERDLQNRIDQQEFEQLIEKLKSFDQDIPQS